MKAKQGKLKKNFKNSVKANTQFYTKLSQTLTVDNNESTLFTFIANQLV